MHSSHDATSKASRPSMADAIFLPRRASDKLSASTLRTQEDGGTPARTLRRLASRSTDQTANFARSCQALIDELCPGGARVPTAAPGMPGELPT